MAAWLYNQLAGYNSYMVSVRPIVVVADFETKISLLVAGTSDW